MPISDKLYEQVALNDDDSHWELHCGRLIRKPAMTSAHNWVFREVGDLLREQLDRRAFVVAVDNAKLRVMGGTFFYPDVVVIPMEMVREKLREPRRFEVFEQPMPLVVEVWSPSTAEYDVDEKLPEYRRRGDLEIWRIHPYERTLTAWRRQPDGSYTETVYRSGSVSPTFLPNIVIDLGGLFALLPPAGA